jgi:hypothetical protein
VFKAAALALKTLPFLPRAGATSRAGPLRKLSKAFAGKFLTPLGFVRRGVTVDVDAE